MLRDDQAGWTERVSFLFLLSIEVGILRRLLETAGAGCLKRRGSDGDSSRRRKEILVSARMPGPDPSHHIRAVPRQGRPEGGGRGRDTHTREEQKKKKKRRGQMRPEVKAVRGKLPFHSRLCQAGGHDRSFQPVDGWNRPGTYLT